MHTAAFVYDWLVSNNLWKDVVQLSVAAIFGYFLARVPWKKQLKKQAENQAELMERLNAETPGGIGDLASLLKLLPQAEIEEEGENT